MKRGRNQRRRQGGPNPNRALDSNGPDVRIRGTANQIYDKYVALARDASSAGDRIKAESYLQHAEHYFRLIRSMQPAQQPAQPQPPAGEGEQPAVEPAPETPAEETSADASANATEEPASTEAAQTETAAEGDAEAKPKRRRGRRPTKRAAKSDDDQSADEPTPAAAE